METRNLPPSRQLIAGKKFSELSPEMLAEYDRLQCQEIDAELNATLLPLLKEHGMLKDSSDQKDGPTKK